MLALHLAQNKKNLTKQVIIMGWGGGGRSDKKWDQV